MTTEPGRTAPTLDGVAATLRSVTLGVVAGFVSGLFGVGGGVIVVPGLIMWMGLDQRRAAATSLATITVSAAAAVILFGRESAVDWPAAGYLLVGAAVGVRLAAHYLDRVPTKRLTWTFAALMLFAAVRLALP
jgi:uncharacterized membrane protein YfcA